MAGNMRLKRTRQRKLHNCLVPWKKLPEEEKEKDRDLVRGIPVILAQRRVCDRQICRLDWNKRPGNFDWFLLSARRIAVLPTTPEQDHQWAQEQIEAYRQAYPRYTRMAQVLQQVLDKATKHIAPLAILQTRPKAIPSYAEKAIRKKKAGRYSNPLVRMTDLCGGRVITQTLTEVRAVCEFIEQHFVIDVENSVDVSQRLKPSEFGYRSVHYIIQFKRGVFPTSQIPVEIPEELYPDEATPMKAEIQVRTVLEHAWAGFVHDRVYKSAFSVPPKWERELAVLAGLLEQTDQSFAAHPIRFTHLCGQLWGLFERDPIEE